MITFRKPEKIDFSEVELPEAVSLSTVTIPEILGHIRSYGKRRRTAVNLQKQFVGAWLRESDSGLMLPDDAQHFVEDYGLVPDLETANVVLGNTVIIPRNTRHYGPMSALHNETWGDGRGSRHRFVIKPVYKEYGILAEDPGASSGYLMAQASVPMI